MANTKQAAKRARQAEKHRLGNKSQITRMNTHLKYVVTAIKEKNADEAKKAYQAAVSVVDKMVTKGLVHKNKASRHKSRLNKQIAALA